MRITAVEPILLKGSETYHASASGAEATDNGDWQLMIRIATDEGLTGWADVETLAPAAVAIIAGQGMAILVFRTLGELLLGENPLDTDRLWDKLYIGKISGGFRPAPGRLGRRLLNRATCMSLPCADSVKERSRKSRGTGHHTNSCIIMRIVRNNIIAPCP
jgi:hypothetical protein